MIELRYLRRLPCSIAVLALVASAQSYRSVSPAERATLAETSALTCSSDAECWCRHFTGEAFVSGRDASRCCTSKDRERFCAAAGVCQLCVYD